MSGRMVSSPGSVLQEGGDPRVAPPPGPHPCHVTKSGFFLLAVLTHLSRDDSLMLLDTRVPGLHTEDVSPCRFRVRPSTGQPHIRKGNFTRQLGGKRREHSGRRRRAEGTVASFPSDKPRWTAGSGRVAPLTFEVVLPKSIKNLCLGDWIGGRCSFSHVSAHAVLRA